jgi:hypothetical protein
MAAPGILSFQRSWTAPRSNTPRLTASCWPVSSGFGTSDTCWKGGGFTIFTDHKPLIYALARTSDPWSARQARQLSYLAEYTDDIRHITGEENIVADTLSPPPPSAAAGIKEPSGSPAAAWQGGKPESSSTSGNESTVVFAVPATGQLIDFAAAAAHQQS